MATITYFLEPYIYSCGDSQRQQKEVSFPFQNYSNSDCRAKFNTILINLFLVQRHGNWHFECGLQKTNGTLEALCATAVDSYGVWTSYDRCERKGVHNVKFL